MNIEQFWVIIELSRKTLDSKKVDGNAQRQSEELRRLLLNLSAGEVVDFRVQFEKRMDEAFQWDLWGAAYIVAGGCSDDGFSDFRSWLISMGRRVFEDAVSNPESLIHAVNAPGVEDIFFEDFRYVAANVHESLTGRALLVRTENRPMAPTGEEWREEELAHRFPALWAWCQRKR